MRPAASGLALAARLIAGGVVYWADDLPDPQTQRIYYANHTSNLDFPVLWAHLPGPIRTRTRPVAAEDYWGRGMRRLVAHRIFRAVLVMRGKLAVEPSDAPSADLGREGVRRMLQGLQEGSSLIIFPEGTRGDGTNIKPFRSGLYHLHQARPDVELVPVYLRNLNRVLPKGHVVPVPIMARIVVGRPVVVDPSEDKHVFLDRARAALEELSQL